MKKRLISTIILIAYSAFVIDLLVFKFNLLQIGGLRFKFSAEAGQANFIPFKTILPYLIGEHGWLIAFANLAGNILLFVPIGFLAAYVYRKMTWQRSLALAVAAGLVIELAEVFFHIGIFDIDDVILNGSGVMIGYWIYTNFVKLS